MSGQGQGMTWHAARLVGQKENNMYISDTFLDRQ